MFNFGFDPEKYASLGSSFDEPDPFAPTPVAPAPKKLPVAPEIVKAPVASVTPKQERVIAKGPAFVAPSAPVETKAAPVKQTATDIVNFANNLQNTRQTARDELGAGSYDANDWAQIAMATPEMEENYRWGTESTKIWNNYKDDFRAYVEDNDIPLTQVRDGITYYLTTDEEGRNDRELGGNYDNFLHGRVSDGVWIDQGPAGTYSTRYIDTSQSAATGLLNNPIMSIAASLAGPVGNLALTAAKAANGQTLHGMDYATVALSGLELSGALKAPATVAEAAKAGEVAGKVALESGKSFAQVAEITGKAAELAREGTGLFGLSYNASKGLINAVAVGDPKAAILGTFGGELVRKGLDGVGLTADVIEGKGIGYNDFTAGLTKVVEEVGNGRDIDEALALGLGKYIREGGTLGAGTADTLVGVVRDIVRPLGSVATDLAHFVEDNLPDTEGLENFVKEVGNDLSDLDTAVRKGLREVDRRIQPVTKPIGGMLSAANTATREVLSEADTLARKGLSEFDDAIINPTGKFLSAADTAARKELTKLDEGLYDIQSPFSTPEIDLPSIDLPSIDLPNFNLPSLGMGMGMLLSGAPAPTATTGKLFENELFKFKNKIELTEFGPLYQPEQEVDIEDFLTSPFESAFTTSQRFA